MKCVFKFVLESGNICNEMHVRIFFFLFPTLNPKKVWEILELIKSLTKQPKAQNIHKILKTIFTLKHIFKKKKKTPSKNYLQQAKPKYVPLQRET
jgi:hypothetical protein